ncbi:MAG: type II toxin-antitoxin system RelE/ParE family toxin [Magnetococcus sp. DMHC-1]|nr:type II toxin-antitoxin system RelE/ParE family toxin [Magnetococcales bacterium]
MIKSFRCTETEKVFRREFSRKFQNIHRVALRKLLMLHAAPSLEALRIPPGNHLETLQGDRAGECSIRINKQWRICFRMQGENVHDVEITDYH